MPEVVGVLVSCPRELGEKLEKLDRRSRPRGRTRRVPGTDQDDSLKTMVVLCFMVSTLVDFAA